MSWSRGVVEKRARQMQPHAHRSRKRRDAIICMTSGLGATCCGAGRVLIGRGRSGGTFWDMPWWQRCVCTDDAAVVGTSF